MGPEVAPKPPTLGTPRPSRGAPLSLGPAPRLVILRLVRPADLRSDVRGRLPIRLVVRWQSPPARLENHAVREEQAHGALDRGALAPPVREPPLHDAVQRVLRLWMGIQVSENLPCNDSVCPRLRRLFRQGDTPQGDTPPDPTTARASTTVRTTHARLGQGPTPLDSGRFCGRAPVDRPRGGSSRARHAGAPRRQVRDPAGCRARATFAPPRWAGWDPGRDGGQRVGSWYFLMRRPNARRSFWAARAARVMLPWCAWMRSLR